MRQQQQRRRDLFLKLDRTAELCTSQCRHCDKVSYRSRSKARKVLQRDVFQGEAMNAYVCPAGNGFHVGHLPRAIRTGATTRQAKYGGMR